MGRANAKWTFAVIVGLVGVFGGVALGVPGGAHLRETGKALGGEAEQFWLGVFLVLSFALGLFRTTRWGAIALTGAYVVALGVGYWAGYHWGNFLGLHPD